MWDCMGRIRKMLANQGTPQALIADVMGKVSWSFADMRHLPQPDPACIGYMEPLAACYQQAAHRQPDMLMQLGAHLTYNAPLGESFVPIFG